MDNLLSGRPLVNMLSFRGRVRALHWLISILWGKVVRLSDIKGRYRNQLSRSFSEAHLAIRQAAARGLEHGSFDGRRYQVWLFPPPLPILQGPTQVRSACQVQFLRGNFFYNNSPTYFKTPITSKKLVTCHPLGRHAPIPYSAWTETHQQNHLEKK